MEAETNITKNTILEPLNLSKVASKNESKAPSISLNCMFCDHTEQHEVNKENKTILQHIYHEHRLVISDVHEVADLASYLDYWKKEFKGFQPEEYCTTMLWKQKPDGTKTEEDEKYYLLSDVLPKDKAIRDELQKKSIEKVLARHQFERTDKNYTRGCLYCRSTEITPTRYGFVEHLYSKHSLQLGKPENLVFIDELIDFLEDKMTSLVCMFCEGVFTERAILKEHMRKKGHKRINPENKIYDKYFMCNYKMKEVPPKTPERRINNPQNRESREKESEEHTLFDSCDKDWSDWEDREQEIEITCLFCSHKKTDFAAVINHMDEQHQFSFDEKTAALTFYQKVKLVNFIRRKIHLMQCLRCEISCESLENLLKHMKSSDHLECNQTDFDKPEFFFPTFEDDPFLCHLDNFNENDEETIDDAGAVVISEDRIAVANEAAELLSREKFVDI